MYELYADGSAHPQTREGGWAFAIIQDGELLHSDSGAATDTTNNRMELMGVIRGLRMLDPTVAKVTVISDSAYVVNCFKQKWYVQWKARSWRNAAGKEVKNRDLWEELFSLVEMYKHPIAWVHVNGHAGHKWNEYCDALCRAAYQHGGALDIW